MKKNLIFIALVILLNSGTLASFGQGAGNDGGGIPARDGMTTDLFLGNVLPNQVTGVTEIQPQGGMRFGWVNDGSGVELSVSSGKGEGVEWGNAAVSLKMEAPVDTNYAVVYLGADITRFQGVGEEMKTFGGGHVGGGLLVPMGASLGFRLDMKFNINPGTSLLITAGVSFLLGGGGAAGGAAGG